MGDEEVLPKLFKTGMAVGDGDVDLSWTGRSWNQCPSKEAIVDEDG